MQIYLPIAEISVAAEAIIGLGVAVGILSGIFGVGGGFFATPLLMFMGIPPAIAVATQANQLVASSLSGVLGHMRRGDVDFKLGGVMVAGSIVGSLIGVVLFRVLDYFGQIDLVIPLLYVLLLGGMGIFMVYESLSALIRKKGGDGFRSHLHGIKIFSKLPYKTRFARSRLYVSAVLPIGIGFISGLLVSMMGIGGGFLMIPAMIYILGMPTLLVAGTTLFQMLLTTIITTLLHASVNQTVDLVLAFMLIIGSVVGSYIGVRMAKWIKGAFARLILASLLLLVSVQLAQGLFIEPVDIYSTVLR